MYLHHRLEEPFRRSSPVNLSLHLLMSYWSEIGHVVILPVTANVIEIPITVCQLSFGMERVLGSLWH